LAKILGADTGQTQSGVLVGTPSYMAPEQAVGHKQSVGPAVDIYALGAILYELLTGRPPFKAATVVETAMLLQTAEAVSPRQFQPHLPRDLETICLKCLMKSPQRRYASAADLADDLRRFLAGESVRARPIGPLDRAWRWSRRRPAVAALAASLLLVSAAAFATVTWQWRQAIGLAAEAKRQEAIAEANYGKVRAAIDDYFTTVSEETLLNQPGLQPLRTKLLQAALAYYVDFIEQRQGDPDFEAELGAAHYRVGRIIQLTGTRQDAERPYNTAIEILEKVVAQNPADARSKQHLARCYNNLAGLLFSAAGDTQRSADLYQKATTLQEQLVEHHPADTEYRHSLASISFNVAMLQDRTGKPDEARAGFARAAALEQRAVAEQPDNPAYLHILALADDGIGRIDLQSGNREDAMRRFRQVADARERIVANNPGVADYLNKLAASYTTLADAFARERNWDEASQWHQKAIGIAERLVLLNPSVREYRDQQIRSYTALSETHARAGDAAAALAVAQQVVEGREALLRQNPGDHSDTIGLAGAYNRLAMRQAALDRLDEARESARKAIATLETISNSGIARYSEEAARGYRLLGSLANKAGDPDEATRAYREAIRMREQLRAQNFTSDSNAAELGALCRNLASTLHTAGRLDEAETVLDKAITVLEPICGKDPQNPRAREELGFAYDLRARIRTEAERYDEAVSDWDRGHDFLTGRYRPQAVILRAWAKAKLGRFDEATADLESVDHELAASGEKSPGATLYTMARVYGRAAIAAADAEQLSEAARREVADQHTKRAVELLIRCRDAGYFHDAEHVREAEAEPDFERVRQTKSIREITAPARD
jgi:tetratricopeptide (TPR) repeat protein